MERPAPVRIFVGHPHWAGGANIRKEPAVASVSHLAPIHLGLDVHKDTISVGILDPDQQVPDVERITHDEASVRRLVARFPDRARLRACYEAGPTGFELARLLHRMHVGCQVIAPSLIPRAPGDKVKTDRRDCRRLARLHRAGELVAIRIPTMAEEAVRDLCRTRAEVVDWRRFASANAFMGFCGLVPSEYSSGNSVHRGRLTKAGNAHLRRQLVESAWSYQHRPSVGVEIARRQHGLDPAVVARAWAAQQRLCARFRVLAARKNIKPIVAAAIARELAGFLWAEMT